MGRFLMVGEDAIRDGRCTDIYFERVAEVMERDGVNPQVTMEVTAAALPDAWGVFCGLSDVVELLEDVPVDVDAMPEGSIFYPTEPVLRISGR
jgi:nicotinate phosphoribosyltransferase